MTGARPVLVVFAGLPGTGKTTVAGALARQLGAAFLRIDVIEQALRDAGLGGVGAAGYGVANAVAESNLRLGRAVVADCVNPVRASRMGWQGVAARAGARLVDVLLVCTDVAEHRRRVERRGADVPGLALPTWDDVVQRGMEPWDWEPFQIDTAALTADQVVEACSAMIGQG